MLLSQRTTYKMISIFFFLDYVLSQRTTAYVIFNGIIDWVVFNGMIDLFTNLFVGLCTNVRAGVRIICLRPLFTDYVYFRTDFTTVLQCFYDDLMTILRRSLPRRTTLYTIRT